MKKYKIAFTGVFDLVNYGDHLFPVVYEEEMKARGVDVELYLFSPMEFEQKFNGDKHIYPLSALEKMQQELKFDAIVVGGGEIIHFMVPNQRLSLTSDEYESYDLPQIWIIPSLVASKYNVRLIWNCPGIPFEFNDNEKGFARALCDCVDYLAVRNENSRQMLINAGIEKEKINVSSDTALVISQHIKENKLLEIRKELLSFEDKYIVFHANRFISDNDIQYVVDALIKFNEEGYKIVLLPLSYTHNDEEAANKIYIKGNEKFIKFDEKLSMMQMLAVLSGCELYTGVSFHGSVTAIEYGKRAVAFDYMDYFKTRDLYSYLELEDYYINNGEKLYETMNKALKARDYKPKENYKKDINNHFDKMIEILAKNKISNGNFNMMFTKAIEKCHIKCDSLTNKETIKYIKALELEDARKLEEVTVAKKYIKELELENARKLEEINVSKKYISDLELENARKLEEINISKKYTSDLELENARKNEELEASKRYTNDLELENGRKAQQIDEAMKYIEKLKEEWENSKNDLQDYMRKYDESFNKNLVLEEENNAFEEKIEELEKQLSDARKTIFYMENTISWKITKPFRKKK